MTMKAQVKMGTNVTLNIDGDKDMDVLNRAITFGCPPRVCDVCKGTSVYPTTNRDKEGNIYVNIKCTCGARAKLGQYKTGGFFWHRFEAYVPPNAQSQAAPAKPSIPQDNVPPDGWPPEEA